MQLTIHTTESAPAASRPVLHEINADLGFVPNLAAVVAESPALLQAFDGLRRAVATIDQTDREVAGLATGVALGNHYGVAFHSTVLASLGVAEDDIAVMRTGAPPKDKRQAAVYEFARALAADRGTGSVEDLEAIGLTAAQILDLVTECVFARLVGLVDNLAGRVQLDAFLQPRAWADPA